MYLPTTLGGLPLALLLWPLSFIAFSPAVAQTLTPPPLTAPGPSSTPVPSSSHSSIISTGSVIPSSSGSSNASSSATPTSSANFPSLSGYSPCVVQCLGLAVAQVGCDSLVEVQCFCNNATKFTHSLLNCTTTSCPSDTGNAEQVAQLFCNVASPSVSLSFPTSSATTPVNGSSTSPPVSSSSSSSAPTTSQTGSSSGASGWMGQMDRMAAVMGVSLVLGGVGVMIGW